MNYRSLAWIFSSILLCYLCFSYGRFTQTFDSAGHTRVYLSFGIALLGITNVFVFPSLSKQKTIGAILLVSSISRICLIPAAGSDDVYRYLWEGKLNMKGISPYQGLANDPVYLEERDEHWKQMNHKDRPTAYPLLSIKIFSQINNLGYSPLSYKLTFLVLDLFLIACLLALLNHYSKPLRWSLFYALSPIALLSYSAEGHFDILMTLPVMLSLLTLSKRWFIISGISLGIAIGTKVLAVVLAPLILYKAGWKAALACIITIALPLLLNIQDVISMFNGLLAFSAKTHFNGPFYQLLSFTTHASSKTINTISVTLFIAIFFFSFWLCYKKHFWEAMLVCWGSLLLLSPIVHFWYLSWILPFVAIQPKLSWISLSMSMSLYFTVWHSLEHHLYWDLPVAAKWGFWLPFGILLVMENRSILKKIKFIISPKKRHDQIQFSVIIPTLNPGNTINKVIQSITEQSHPPHEIIISDATSSDHFLDDLPNTDTTIKIISSSRGRGNQISDGVQHASGSWAVIVHADNLLSPDSFATLYSALKNNPSVIGGSLGQRFDQHSIKLLFIEALNEFRATLLHTSFGDQNQFLHIPTARENSILTKQPLMEDVEISDRLNSLGETLHLAHESKVSAIKWNRSPFITRFSTIIEFYIKYRLFFWSEKKRHSLSQRFYDRYYPPKKKQS